jgi:hypothetical protein
VFDTPIASDLHLEPGTLHAEPPTVKDLQPRDRNSTAGGTTIAGLITEQTVRCGPPRRPRFDLEG